MPAATAKHKEKTMPRFLILHASVGGGHRSAALALEQAFKRLPDSEERVEDTLDYASALFRTAYARSYLELSQRAPLVWQMFYESTDLDDSEWTRMSDQLRGLVAELAVTGLKRMIRKYAPAAIVCTHFLPAELLMRMKLGGDLRQPTYTVITDHAVHSNWITPGVDGYFVASEFPCELMIARGVPAAIVHVTGIPVNPETAIPKEPQAMRTRHDLPLDRPVIALFGGGLVSTRVRRIVKGMLALDEDGLLVVVAGRNAELPAALADLGDGRRMRLRVLSHVDYVDDLIAASDLVITKAGGLIVSEVLARGTPLLVIDPIPGQEEWNADYLVSSGAGLQLRLPEWVPWTVQQLLNDRQRLSRIRGRAERAGRPRAANDIAEIVSRAVSSVRLA
jgi:processive 1,2-diacylglycerol beta-glucosyltransferase